MALLTVTEIDELPDDPDAAFVQLERICRTRLNEYTSQQDRYEDGYALRIEYMTIVASAAKSYGVADFDMPMEGWENRDFDLVYKRSIAISTMLTIEAKRARSLGSATLTQGTKERLKKHLTELRSALDAAEFDAKRKKILTERLNSFENELSKEKSSLQNMLVAVALVTAALNQGTGTINGVQDTIIKLPETIKSINALLGRDKLAEMESAPDPLPLPPSVTKALPPPKSASSSDSRPKPGAFDDDLDDDVPF